MNTFTNLCTFGTEKRMRRVQKINASKYGYNISKLSNKKKKIIKL